MGGGSAAVSTPAQAEEAIAMGKANGTGVLTQAQVQQLNPGWYSSRLAEQAAYGTGQGNAPAPTPTSLTPRATTPTTMNTQPATAAVTSPAPIPGLTGGVPIASAPNVTNPATTASSDVSSGIDASFNNFNPANSGFSIGSIMGAGTIPDAASPTAASYTPGEASQLGGATNWNVTAPQTVAGQFAQDMSQANPAIQAVEQQTIRANAAHGGANDLMAQTAATMAGAQVGLQIASQDAQTNAAAGQFNASAANQFSQQQNQFIQNATLSQQNFQQGVAMLHDQTNQSFQQLYAQVEAGAATASTNVKATLDTTQASLKSTLAQMGQQFADTTSQAAQQEGYNVYNANTQYGMNVQLSYLSSVNTQQASLMQTIAQIQSNPNINTAQANAAIQNAVDQFNSFMTMNNAYYSSMMPASGTSGVGTTAGGAPTGTSPFDSTATGGGFAKIASMGTGLTPSAPSPAAVSPTSQNYTGMGMTPGTQTNVMDATSLSSLMSGASANFSNGQLMGSDGQSLGSASDVLSQMSGLVTGGASAITEWANNHRMLATALGLLVPGAGTVLTVAKIINWLHNMLSKPGPTTPNPLTGNGVPGSYGNQLNGIPGSNIDFTGAPYFSNPTVTVGNLTPTSFPTGGDFAGNYGSLGGSGYDSSMFTPMGF